MQQQQWPLNEIDDFVVDDDWQRAMRDAFLVPHLYEHRYKGHYELFDHDLEMQSRGIDTRCITGMGDHFTIDEKIVRFRRDGQPYTAFCVETHSCTREHHRSMGWLFYSEADFLLYCRMDAAEREMRIHMMHLSSLRRWFSERFEQFATFGPLPTKNATFGRVVPFARLDASLYWPMTIYRDGRVIGRGFPGGARM